MIRNENFHLHQENIKRELRKSTEHKPADMRVLQQIVESIGYEATIGETIERLNFVKELIEKYEAENKLQNSRTSNVGFEIS